MNQPKPVKDTSGHCCTLGIQVQHRVQEYPQNAHQRIATPSSATVFPLPRTESHPTNKTTGLSGRIKLQHVYHMLVQNCAWFTHTGWCIVMSVMLRAHTLRLNRAYIVIVLGKVTVLCTLHWKVGLIEICTRIATTYKYHSNLQIRFLS